MATGIAPLTPPPPPLQQLPMIIPVAKSGSDNLKATPMHRDDDGPPPPPRSRSRSPPRERPHVDPDDGRGAVRVELRQILTPDSMRSKSPRRGTATSGSSSPAPTVLYPEPASPTSQASTIPYDDQGSLKRQPERSGGDSPPRSTARSSNDPAPDSRGVVLPEIESDEEDEPPDLEPSEPDDAQEMATWLAELASDTDDHDLGSLLGECCRRADMANDIIERDVDMAEVYLVHDASISYMYEIIEKKCTDDINIGVEGDLAECHGELGGQVRDGDVLVYSADLGDGASPVIQKDLDTLTKEELVANKHFVTPAKLKEIVGLHELKCLGRYPRRLARNRVDT